MSRANQSVDALLLSLAKRGAVIGTRDTGAQRGIAGRDCDKLYLYLYLYLIRHDIKPLLDGIESTI